MAGWRIEMALDGARVNFGQPVTEAGLDGDIAEAWWSIEVLQPTIGVVLTAIPHRGYRPAWGSCGHVSRTEDELIPSAFEGDTITFTHDPDVDFDSLTCVFGYVGPPPAPSLSPALPPTDTVAVPRASADGSGRVALTLLAAIAAAAIFLTRAGRRRASR
jgi:hypothetical protein